MKVHIVSKYDTLDKIINNYAISLKELKAVNPEIDFYTLKDGDRIIIEHNKSLFKDVDNDVAIDSEEYQKYICPHCKQIILIPK